MTHVALPSKVTLASSQGLATHSMNRAQFERVIIIIPTPLCLRRAGPSDNRCIGKPYWLPNRWKNLYHTL
jgi:hypothetical protein